MSRSSQRRRALPSPAGEVRAGGAHVLEAAFGTAADPRSLQLCAQARHALEVAFAVECRDEALRELVVVTVRPDPTVRRLRVWLRGPAEMGEEHRGHVLRRLTAARGFLRAQVAQGIYRKRTPELAFELLAGTECGGDRAR